MRGEYPDLSRLRGFAQELPPRARRIPFFYLPPPALGGTTSACAENTASSNMLLTSHRNYLRVRGEYLLRIRLHVWRMELPPRARRIPAGDTANGVARGTTSACAENTRYRRLLGPCSGNYLRVRGEYVMIAPTYFLFGELPPRARRILAADQATRVADGTTSACAENTLFLATPRAILWNYLRVRGEYKKLEAAEKNLEELPPRARRIRFCCPGGGHCPGTTSACAENTGTTPPPDPRDGNYLRVRGEYPGLP